MTAKDTPGVIAPPPLIFLGFLIVGFALNALVPLRLVSIDPKLNWTIGAVLILVGVVAFALAIRNFMRAATPVPTRKPTRTLVTTGIHARSRNPIYVAMFLISDWSRTQVGSFSFLCR
jgi:protein-S-isoprenylcysteine O-methyltransferase Ste14